LIARARLRLMNLRAKLNPCAVPVKPRRRGGPEKMANNHLRDAVMAAVTAAGGVVVVNGRTMIKVEVVRSVMRDMAADLFADARNRLTGIVAGNAAAEKQLAAELDESERRLEKSIADILPIMN
jgi:hypothetical protein